MKKVLIISPHFPPINAPDMQRIRMSLPYFEQYGWKPTIISVNENYVDGLLEEYLNETIPEEVEVHKTNAINRGFTEILGIRNVALRSIYHFYNKGCEILSSQKFDLIFFSTSNFHICVLGPIWKRKFDIPFIIDFQDPWFGLNGNGKGFNVKHELSTLIHKKLEKFTVPLSAGAIAVSQAYIDNLNFRYKAFRAKPTAIINFGNSEIDFEIVRRNKIQPFSLTRNKINVVSAGALTTKFLPVIEAFFRAFLDSNLMKSDYKFYFIGTSYFKTRTGILSDLINDLQIQDLVYEYPNRIGYFQSLATMKAADIIFLPGSIDGDYNPSKICNVIKSGTPVFSAFNSKSIVHELVTGSDAGISISIENGDSKNTIYEKIKAKMIEFSKLHLNRTKIIMENLKPYEAKQLTRELCLFFDRVVS